MIQGVSWSFAETLANQGVRFVIGIVLARLLSPREFGLIGMTVFFTAISQSFIDSGFSQALIRKINVQNKDYCTVFYYNFFIGILFYFILFFSAGPLSIFFNEPQLFLLVRILSLILLINSLGLIQRTILIKNIDFKLQTKISAISSLTSGAIGIGMAYSGWGVWSLVWMTVLHSLITTALLWIWNSWRPSLLFSMTSFRDMFNFGSKLLASSLIDITYRNIYYLVIGKYFSAVELGYYTRADEFRNIPSSHFSAIIGRVTYPVLARIQNDDKKLLLGFKKILTSTVFISSIMMIGMAAVSKPMILVLIGEKWMSTVPYLQLLCFVGLFYPLHVLNLNILKVKGRSDLFFRLEVIKKFFAIPIIILGIYFGIKLMIVGMIINSIFAYGLNSYWSGKLIAYPTKEQLADIAPSILLAIIMGIMVFAAGELLPLNPTLMLLTQLIIGASTVIVLAKLMKLDAFVEILNIVSDRLPWKK